MPHYLYRMDHAYKRHRNWLAPGIKLDKLPSEYFSEHIYTTFQDDWVAFKSVVPCASSVSMEITLASRA